MADLRLRLRHYRCCRLTPVSTVDGVLYQESAQQVIGECTILATKTLPDGSQLSAGCGLIKTTSNGFLDSTFGVNGVIAFNPQPTAAAIDGAGNAYRLHRRPKR